MQRHFTAELLIPAFLLAFGARAQTPDKRSDEMDPLLARITLEDILAFDPWDPFFSDGDRDRDPVDDVDAALPGPPPPRTARSRVTIGYAGAMRETESGWTGSPDRAILRMDLVFPPALDVGLTGEKDAGERWDLGFCSAYVALRDLPLDGECVLGDYNVQAGCGLIIGNAAAPVGVAGSIRGMERSKPELISHRSRDEFGFLRGIAILFSPPVHLRSRCVVFASRRSLPSSGEGESPSVSRNSLFRTDAEIRRKDGIRERIAGCRLSVELGGDVRCAATLLHTRLEPTGRISTLAGLDFSARSGPFLLKGELARSPVGAIAAVFLGSVALNRNSSVALAMQFLSAGYANHRFESLVTSAVCNENSYRFSAECGISSRVRIEGFIRQRWTPSIPQNRLSRSDGWNGGLGGTIDLGRSWQFRWLYRQRRGDCESTVPLPEGGGGRRLIFTGGETAKFSLHYHLGRKTECQTTFQTVRSAVELGGDLSRGEQLRQEVHWKSLGWLAISIAGAIFSADAFAARTSSLEDDAISHLRIESLDGDGFRWALTLAASPPRTSLTVLAMVTGTEQIHRLRPPRVPERGEWGLRVRWIQ